MAMSGEVKQIGMLMLVLFVIGIITAVTYIGFGYLKETACETSVEGYTWNLATCYSNGNFNGTVSEAVYNATPPVEVTITAVTKIGVVENVLEVVLGLLTLIVVVSLFAIVIKSAKGFSGGKDF